MNEMLAQEIRDGGFMDALVELEKAANAFGFFRAAAQIVDSYMNADLTELQRATILDFANNWVLGLKKMAEAGACDVRNQSCLKVAEKLVEEGIVTGTASPEFFEAMRGYHRTVLQQASILAFLIIDRFKGKPDFALFSDWYKMPLI